MILDVKLPPPVLKAADRLAEWLEKNMNLPNLVDKMIYEGILRGVVLSSIVWILILVLVIAYFLTNRGK